MSKLPNDVREGRVNKHLRLSFFHWGARPLMQT